MFRATIILTTVLAVILGSLGLPVYLHACQMRAEVAKNCPICNPKPSCPLCAQEEGQSQKKKPEHQGMAVNQQSCCKEHQLIQHTDPTVLTKPISPVFLLHAAIIVAFVLADGVNDAVVTHRSENRPPPLASRAQHTYLFNSTFLI